MGCLRCDKAHGKGAAVMKRGLIILLSLMIVLACYAGIRFSEIKAAGNDIKLEESVFCGDPKAAAGLHMRLETMLWIGGPRHYFFGLIYESHGWITDISFDEEGFSSDTHKWYRIEKSYEDDQPVTGEADKSLDPDSYFTNFPYDSYNEYYGYVLSKNGDIANVFVRDNENYVVCSIDRAGGEILKETVICPVDLGVYQGSYIGEDHMLFIVGDRILYYDDAKGSVNVLTEDEQGFMTPKLRADLEDTGAPVENIRNFIAWGSQREIWERRLSLYEDGKLYLTAPDVYDVNWNYSDGRYSYGCGISIAVFDETGALFCANYKSDLSGKNVYPAECTAPEIWIE